MIGSMVYMLLNVWIRVVNSLYSVCSLKLIDKLRPFSAMVKYDHYINTPRSRYCQLFQVGREGIVLRTITLNIIDRLIIQKLNWTANDTSRKVEDDLTRS